MKHSGRPTSLANAQELCECVVNLRCEGMPISINMVILRASQLDERFHQKRMQTKYSVVRQLLRSHSIAICSKTHQAQRHPKEMVDEVKHFVSRDSLPRTMINGTLLIWIKHQFFFNGP